MYVVCANLGSRDLDRFGLNLKLLESECRYPKHHKTKYPKAALHKYIPKFDFLTTRTIEIIKKEKNRVRRDALIMEKVVDKEIVITLGTGSLAKVIGVSWPGKALGIDRKFIRVIDHLGKHVTTEFNFYAWARYGIEYGLGINDYVDAQSMPVEHYLNGLLLE